MNRRSIYLIIASIVIGVLTLTFIVRSKSGVGGESGEGVTTDDTSTNAAGQIGEGFRADAPQGTTITLNTGAGGVIVNNFYHNAVSYEDGTLVIAREDAYFISYDTFGGAFWIAVTESPFSSFRAAAERRLLTILGISQQDACKLDVRVSPYDAAANPMKPTFCL